jgi:hypothetical protein
MDPRNRFGDAELKVVRAQLGNAESLLSHYYCISSREWSKYPYEVKTLADLQQGEISPGSFATVAKYQSISPQGSPVNKQIEYFGICLQDHNILEAARRDLNLIAFESLMLYILTHELVHVFRFANEFQAYDAGLWLRGSEESRVHKITQDILSTYSDPRLFPILKAYRKWLM